MLHYGRCLEASANPANRFRAIGVYQSLFDCCKKRSPPLCGVEEFTDFRLWIESASTWKLLGDYAHYKLEELIARDCYKIYVDKVNTARLKEDVQAMDIDVLMKIARNCASMPIALHHTS